MAKTLRCAIYTRKSSEEGLEQDFNSLHAQREACEAFIKSQKHEGWQLIKTAYDDGGISGGTMERPGLQQLLTDIQARRIDVVVVYKVDRLTRSLSDFARMVEIFDATGVSFVSVTQQFNTTSSMGRLTLNVLLSFAQFEREVTGERIRDKIAASKKKGIWMGGPVPLGYEAQERKLLIKPKEAETVRQIYRRYLELGCVRLLQKDITECGIRSINGHVLARGTLYKMLANPIYIGQIRHKDICHPGQHESIIDRALWDQVQQCLAGNRIGDKMHSRKTEPSPLTGKLFDVSGERLVPVHANKKGRRYRYYVSQSLLNNPKDEAMSSWRLPAREIDQVVERNVLSILRDRDVIANALCDAGIASQHVPAALKAIDDIDGAAILEKFAERVELSANGIRMILSLPPVNDTPVKIIRDISMIMKRRGVEMRMVIGNTQLSRMDHTLIRVVAKAHHWFEELVTGKVESLTELAKQEKMSGACISYRIKLAFLAPDIVEAIMAGQQPPELTAQKLIRGIDLPIEWDEQRRILGFN